MKPTFVRTLLIIFFVTSLCSGGLFANDALEARFDSENSVDLLADGDLSAWEKDSDIWSYQSGSIVGDTGPDKISIPKWIYTKERFGDFAFTCELMLSGDEKRNTGIYYRVSKIKYGKGKGFEAPSGYEFDAAYHDGSKKRNWRGTLGDWYARPKLRVFPDPEIINEAFKTDEWNRMTLRARGDRLEYWINGVKIMDYVDSDPNGSNEGVIGFQIHNGSVMKVEYRNIRVREL